MDTTGWACFSARQTRSSPSGPRTSQRAVHYAAAELFMSYLLDHYGGRQNAAALVGQDADSIRGVQAYLDGFGAKFDDVFADWVIANYLDLDSGPYSHLTHDATTGAVEEHRPRSWGGSGRSVRGGLPGGGRRQLLRSTARTRCRIGVPPRDGAFWWANRGDSIDTPVDARVRPQQRDERDAQFLHLVRHRVRLGLRLRGGVNRRRQDLDGAARRPTTTDFNPVGAAYGHGYTGSSEGWVQEEVDLSALRREEGAGAFRVRD